MHYKIHSVKLIEYKQKYHICSHLLTVLMTGVHMVPLHYANELGDAGGSPGKVFFSY